MVFVLEPVLKREEIERQLSRRGRSLRWLAKQLEVNHQALLNWLNGENAPRDETIWQRITDIVTREVEEPLFPVALPEAVIPLWPWHPAGAWCKPEESTDWFEAPNFLVKKGRIATRVVGDSMEPLIYSGDYLIFHLDSSPRFGRVVIARNEAGEGTVKTLRRRPDGKPFLEPINNGHTVPDVDHLEVVGYLVAILRNYDEGRGEIIWDEGGIAP